MQKNLLLFVLIFLCSRLSAQVRTIHGFQTIPITLERISPPLRDIAKHPYPESPRRVERDNPSLEHPKKNINPDALPQGADPAWQKDFPAGLRDANINVISTWEGMSENVDPSDNTIAVGPNDVVQMVNGPTETYIRIWDKSGNILIDELAVSDISGHSDFGDPNIVYDPVADRFVLNVLNATGNKLIVCISQTGDPTGSWYSYLFTTAGGFPDYPKIAFWGNSYFITTNSNSPSVFALNRDSLLAGASIGPVQKFSMTSLPTIDFQSASPVHFTGSQLPDTDTPAYLIRVVDDGWGGNTDSDHIEIFHVNIDWQNVSNSFIQGPFALGTIPYNSLLCSYNSGKCIPQPGTTQKLDPLSNIVMDKVQYRRVGDHESIVCSNVCNADGNGLAGIRWYELRKNSSGNWFIYQQGTYAPDDSIHRWMSSITINDDGTIALGYNVSNGSSIYPGARLTARTSCDSLNIMTAGETDMVDGASKNGSNRYGDYNGMMTDPSDGSFWFTAQYNPANQWSTSVIHFSVTNCLATAAAQIDEEGDQLKIVPVPAEGMITVSLKNSYSEPSTVYILDRTGVIVFQKTVALNVGSNIFTLDVKNLASGVYMLKLPCRSRTLVSKFIVQHE